MVLAKFAAFERRSGSARPPGYESRPVRWIVYLDSEGNPEGGRLRDAMQSQSGTPDGGGKRRQRDAGKPMVVPAIKRTIDDKPALLADNAEYVFGLPRKEGSEGVKRAENRQKLFRELVAACAQETGLSEVKAVSCFLATVVGEMPADLSPEDVITFRVDGALVTDLPQVQEYWARHFEAKTQVSARMRKQRSSDDADDAAALVSQCLVCGQARPVAATHPVAIAGIPGGRSTLVSFNMDAFQSYGLNQSHNAPVCVGCAQDYARGLNRLLAGEDTSLRLGEIAYVFWTREADDDTPRLVTGILGGKDSEDVKQLLQAPLESGAAATRPAQMAASKDAFYAAAFTAHKGRAVMLSWLETTTAEAVENLSRYVRAQAIPTLYPDQPRFFSVYKLAASLLPSRRRRGSEASQLDQRVIVQLVEYAVSGAGLPPWALFQAVRRCRAECEVPAERAALIQLALTAQDPLRGHDRKETAVTNETQKSPAFLCGRLLAILEWAQREAIGNPNTTLVDRFYGSASASPASVFGTLMRNAQAHLGKLRRERRGLYITIERQLEEVLSQLQAFPAVLSLRDQAVFALGYYYQRATRGRPQTSDVAEPTAPAS